MSAETSNNINTTSRISTESNNMKENIAAKLPCELGDVSHRLFTSF